MPRRVKQDPKLDALKSSGTLNPKPEKVIDDRFNAGEFFDARDLMQVKYEMVRRVSEDGWSITEAASAFGFSRSSFYQAQSDFNEAGISGFIPERRGPREAHKLSGRVLKFIEETKMKNSSITTANLVALIKEEFGIEVHRRSIERAINRKKKRDQLPQIPK
jgi:transposase